MAKLHCMVDVETLATRPDAAIIQIGGCMFDPESDLITNEFCINVDPQSSKELGGYIDPETVKWWMKQNKDVIKSLQTDQRSLKDAMLEVSAWYKKANGIIWSWGSSFDAPVLENAFIACGMLNPWQYWNFQCARTIAKTFNIDKDRGANTHNAQYDAVDQARVLQKFYQALSS